MEQVTVSSKGQIAIPKRIRQALNLREGTRLNLEVRGHEVVLSKEPIWKKLQASAGNLMDAFQEFRKEERRHEDAGS